MVSFYRSPSQSSNEFETFLANLEKLISDISSSHSDFVVLICGFNAKSRDWSNHVTTTEGAQLNSLLISFNMKQLITEPTYIVSCIDLIFTNQPTVVLDSGVHF